MFSIFNSFKKYYVLCCILCIVLFFSISIYFVSADTCPLQTTNLSKSNYKGHEGEVLALQMMLSQLPEVYPDGIMSGTFGNLTENAIKKLQSDNGLNPTGILDTDTIDIFCNYYNNCPFQTLLLGKDSTEVYEIKALQSLLSFLGYYTYPSITGTFGSVTEKSLKSYQSSNNLYPTGLVDYDTQTSLCNTFSNLSNIKTTIKSTPSTSKPVTQSNFKVSCYASPNPVKTNTNVTFYASVSNGKEPYTYEWYGSGSGNSKSFTRSFTTPGIYEVNLKVTDASKQTKTSKCNISVYEPPRTGLSSFLPSFLLKDTTPSVKLTANTYTIDPNTSVTLSWDSTNTSNCFILSSPTNSDFSGSVSVSGSKTISNISQTTLFSIMCTKDTLSTFDYISVNVNQGLNLANLPPDTVPTQTPPISTIALTPSSKSSSSSSSSSSTSSSTTTTTKENAMYKALRSYQNKPVQLKCDTWPKEIVIGDPVKFEISGFPKDFGYTTKRYIYDTYHSDQYLAEIFDNYLETKTRDTAILWGGDVINFIVSYLQTVKDKPCSIDPLSAENQECKKVREGIITIASRDNWLDRSYFDIIYKGQNKTLKPYWATKQLDTRSVYGLGDYDHLYWLFDKSGDYTIKYEARFEGKPIATSECKIKVLDKPTEINYLKVFVTSEAYSGNSFDSADSICDDLADKAGFEGQWKAFTDNAKGKLPPAKAIDEGLSAEYLPYRDLAGRLIAYNYDYLFNKLSTEGGGQWYPIKITESKIKKAGLFKSGAKTPEGNPVYFGSIGNKPIDSSFPYYWAFESGDCSSNIPPQGVVCLEDPYMYIWTNVDGDHKTSQRGTKWVDVLNQRKSTDKLACRGGYLNKTWSGIWAQEVNACGVTSWIDTASSKSKSRFYCFQTLIKK